MLIDLNAPVVLAAEIHIEAPKEVVWDVLTDVQAWPKWHPGVRSVVAERSPGLEMTFRWRPGPYQIVSTVQEFEPQKRIGWTGRSPGVAARHVWTIRSGPFLVEEFHGRCWAGSWCRRNSSSRTQWSRAVP
jgi:uncharacterized protein YndB with AHSA1/START domain